MSAARGAILAVAFAFSIAIITAAQGAYDPRGKRNPFVPPTQATPSAEGLTGGEEVDASAVRDWFASHLDGIMWDQKTPYALVGDRIVSVGEAVRGCTVAGITEGSVILSCGGERVEVPLGQDKKENARDDQE